MILKIPFERVLLYSTAFITLALLMTAVRTSFFSSKEIAFVDISKLTENYKYKQDMEGSAAKSLHQTKSTIDSLKLLQHMQVRTGANLTQIDSLVARAEYAFNQYYMRSNQEISKKIWDRLNPVITQYGKDRNLELLIGANGAGTVLYGSEQQDVTDDLISYVNTKYENGI
jgi:outer membrane protein